MVTTSNADPFCNPIDTEEFVARIENKDAVKILKLENYNHLDYVWADDACRDLYPKIFFRSTFEGLSIIGISDLYTTSMQSHELFPISNSKQHPLPSSAYIIHIMPMRFDLDKEQISASFFSVFISFLYGNKSLV